MDYWARLIYHAWCISFGPEVLINMLSSAHSYYYDFPNVGFVILIIISSSLVPEFKTT